MMLGRLVREFVTLTGMEGVGDPSRHEFLERKDANVLRLDLSTEPTLDLTRLATFLDETKGHARPWSMAMEGKHAGWLTVGYEVTPMDGLPTPPANNARGLHCRGGRGSRTPHYRSPRRRVYASSSGAGSREEDEEDGTTHASLSGQIINLLTGRGRGKRKRGPGNASSSDDDDDDVVVCMPVADWANQLDLAPSEMDVVTRCIRRLLLLQGDRTPACMRLEMRRKSHAELEAVVGGLEVVGETELASATARTEACLVATHLRPLAREVVFRVRLHLLPPADDKKQTDDGRGKPEDTPAADL
jgi:hypothetical protein